MQEQHDKIVIKEKQEIGAGLKILEKFRLRGRFNLEVFHVKKSGNIFLPDFSQAFDNLTTNAGGAALLDLLIGAGGTAFNNANSYIGVGDSNTAPAVGQTNLQAATNKLRKAMEATFPSRSGQVVTFRSVFATGDANWSWEEMGIFNHASAGTMLCRALVPAPFTKTSSLSITSTYTTTMP